MTFRYVHDFEIDQHAEVIKAYLQEGKSHRAIQREILGLPAPANGGGFIAMNILHHYDIYDDKKAILQNSTTENELKSASPQYKEALLLLKTTDEFGKSIKNIVSGNLKNYKEPTGPTVIPTMVKRRVSQHILRDRVIDNYATRCAVCEVDASDLLICSHIKPWAVDEANRLNPRNAISLCVWHDRLFDKGYFSLSTERNIILGENVPRYIENELVEAKFRNPKQEEPDQVFLDYHRENILKKGTATGA